MILEIGEEFKSRGLGCEFGLGCFVCGGPQDTLVTNISGFVQTKESGEKVVKFFKVGARLDYRQYEPQWIQVKIGCCDKHLKNLQKLHEEVTKQHCINQRIVDMVSSI